MASHIDVHVHVHDRCVICRESLAEGGTDSVDIKMVDVRPGPPCFDEDGLMHFPEKVFGWVHLEHLN